MTRQLTAIMFADMVGYTALMQEDERRAKQLRDRQREVLELRVAEFEGKIVQFYGDGALCGFQSAIQAVECAVAVQVDLRQGPTVPVRIGIHLGDVAYDQTGVYGDGVNLASRIQALSVPGGVLISGKVADEVENQPGISTRLLARVALKNVREPRRVFAVTQADLAVPTGKDVKGWTTVDAKGRRTNRGVKVAWWGVALAIAVGLSSVIFSRLSEPEATQVSSLNQEDLAILPFVYVGPQEHEWTGAGMAIQLIGPLTSGVFLPVDQYSIHSLVEGLEAEGFSGRPLWEEVAETSDASLLLHGELSAEPDGALSVNAFIYDPRTAEDVGSAFARGTVEEFNSLVLGVAGDLLVDRSGVDPALRADLLLTGSIDALKASIEGDRAFRAGDYPLAVTLLKEATKADSGLGVAHYRLSQAAIWAWEWDLARTAADDAWALSSGLSALNQLLLRAWRDFLSSRPVESVRTYQALRYDHPQNVEVLTGLGSVLLFFNSLQGRESSEADRFFRTVMDVDPDYGEVRYHMLEAAASNDDQVEFDRWYAGLNPESEQALAFEAVRAFGWGSRADQQAVIRKLGDADEMQVVYAAGRVAAFLRDFSGAGEIGDLLLSTQRNPDFRWAAHALRAALAFAQGRWSVVDGELNETAGGEAEWSLEMRALFSMFPILQVPPEDLRSLRVSIRTWDPEAFVLPSFLELFGPHSEHHREFRLYLLGLLSARLNELEDAREYRDSLGEYGRAPETRERTHSFAQSVNAHIAHTEGDPETALRILDGADYFPRFEYIFASPFFSRALDRWLRAELEEELGRPTEALGWYATLSDGWGEFLFAAPAHMRQAQIHEGLGEVDEAIDHYERFEALWADADPELQLLVEEARTARERLVGSGGPG